jgi:hypothetical protein
VIVDVVDLFDFKIPSDVGRLDWLERQVIIDVDRDDWDAVAGDVDQTRETFDRVKDDVIAAGGEEEALDFEASVVKQGELAASRDPAIVDEANVALELVDASTERRRLFLCPLRQARRIASCYAHATPTPFRSALPAD